MAQTTTSLQPEKRARSIQIDFLRGIAILLVLGRHATTMEAGFFAPVQKYWFQFGWTGVDLFFVLSGFLVGGLLIQELLKRGQLDVKRFMVRRAFKIWPSYYVFLLYVGVYILMMREHKAPGEALAYLLPNLFHLQNYSTADHLFTGQTWSLAIEEHFYLVLPFVIWLITRKNLSSLKTLLPGIGFSVVAVCLALRCFNLRYPYTFETQSTPTHLRVDSLFIGVLLAYLYYSYPHYVKRLSRYRIALFLLGTAFVSPMMFLDPASAFVHSAGYTMLALGYAMLIMAVLAPRDQSEPSRTNIVTRIVAFIGFYSYSIYLWHLLPGRLLVNRFTSHGWLEHQPEFRWLVAQVLWIVGATIVGVIFGKLIEYPALALRERLFPSRSGMSVRSQETTTPDSNLGVLPVAEISPAGR